MNIYRKAIIHDVPTLYKVPAILIGMLSPKVKNRSGAEKPIANTVMITIRANRLTGIICHKLYPTYRVASM